MNSTTYDELNRVLHELYKIKENLQSQIDENSIRIQEVQNYAKGILSKEDEDFKMFSPRKAENIYKDELEESRIKQADYENQENQLLGKREKLNSLINVMQKIAEEDHPPVSNNQESSNSHPQKVKKNKQGDDRELLDSIYLQLSQVMNKIELSAKFSTQDPARTKMELKLVNENLKKIIDEIDTTDDVSCETQVIKKDIDTK
jgi:hypothetical protein